MKRAIFLLTILIIAISACEDPFINQPFIAQSNEDIELSNASFLKKYSEKYSLWIELLKYADMFNALNDASTISTVFAPDNEAMLDFMEWKGVDSIKDLDKTYARYVAQVHILNFNLTESNFISYVETGTIPVITVFGTFLNTSYGFIDKSADDSELANARVQDSLSIYLNNQAKIKSLARTTANGQVYTLGGVIRPLAETIPDMLRQNKEYSIFVDAIVKTAFDDDISVYSDTVYNLDGSYSVNDIKFTCFAVPDNIYKSSGINNVDELISKLGASGNFTDTQNALNQYVRYHFIGKSYTKSELFNFQEAGQISIFDTKLTNQVITAQIQNESGIINKVARITKSGIEARNGLIHKIDHIMPVYEPAPVIVRWDFNNYPDIESFINSYGASKNIGELFSNALSNKEYQVDLSLDQREGNNGTISSFIYQANSAKTNTATWRRIGFFKCSYLSSTEKNINKYNAYMDNLMVINLGYAGWVQFKTPTIIKGKYKVTFYYAGAAGLKSFYPSGSLTKFNLDDYQKSIYVWKGLPAKFTEEAKKTNANASGIAADVLWDKMEFSNSESHTLKVTLMDILAKTNGSYRQMWDYIEFVPIAD